MWPYGCHVPADEDPVRNGTSLLLAALLLLILGATVVQLLRAG